MTAPPPTDELLTGLVGFTEVLRAAGVPVTQDRVTAFLQALDTLDVTDREQAYWAGRLTLCGDPDDVVRYDLAFPSWFEPSEGRRATNRDERPPAPPRLAALVPGREGAGEDDTDDDGPQIKAAATGTEVLRSRDLGELSPAEREHLRRLMTLLRPEPPTRASRRRRPHRRGTADPQRTLRTALRNQGELSTIRRRDSSRRPRKVVLLIDVSGSMEPYADALMRFAHVFVRRSPRSVEAFTLGTRLTRITRELRLRDPERALGTAGKAIPDWSGGTRLGELLKAFVDRWGRRGAARRAVVVVFSDGWERGGTELLGEQVEQLSRLAHRLIWVNPHAGKDGYAPVQGGIVAALPHLDDLLAGHSLDTLEKLLKVVRDA
ncbi:von Willebrand factor A [Pseudonocardia sp. EC080619-01]|uniref:vWA domain-containing protein n=1 Tax=Pseudonocardia sp. EC080619-01 TaxID=1096856 RepID=UPI0007063E0F|nr:VWA domain-containing protein [Pseudonocardia sp. EC080619-01]ALL82247.1 von Willebrand factor A [Pseudonocardia sp. EC080619-01]